MPEGLLPGSPLCKYHEICGLSAAYADKGEEYCILHLPEPAGKNIPAFERALGAHLEAGRCDFRYFSFPAGAPAPNFAKRHFASLADFRWTIYSEMLHLTECLFEKGLLLGGTRVQVQNVDLTKAVVRGPLQVEASINNTLRLNQGVFEDKVEVDVESLIHLQAWGAQFHQVLHISAPEVGSLNLASAELRAGLLVRGRVQRIEDLHQMKCSGRLDLRECEIYGGLSLTDVQFEDVSVLDLGKAKIRGDLVLAGPPLPQKIILDAATITGVLQVKTEAGTRRPRIIARNQGPRYERSAELDNVDLTECRLVGNPFLRAEFANVEWPRRAGRCILYDEAALRNGDPIPLSNLREAYQILKEKYREMGDQVRSGDFHYGEMEMRRREYRFPRRVLSLEFLYWALSGYGMGSVRAFLLLMILGAGCAYAYLWASPASFSSGWDAAHFSFSVMTLQRPVPPTNLSMAGKWLQLGESILGPMQIALFALALRMRLKR